MKKSLLSGLLLAYACASAQIIVTESFEGTSLPSGFESFKNVNHSQIRVPLYGTRAGSACDGAKTLYANLYDYNSSGENNQWYLVYSSPHSNGTDLTYSFKYSAKRDPDSDTTDGSISVEYSTDGGANWTVSTPAVTFDSTVRCQTISGVIAGANIPAGTNFKMRIVSKSINNSGIYMGIDHFTANQVLTSPPNCPVITIPTQGSVLNSVIPMIAYDSVAGASGYKISIGTTPGGTDIMNNIDNQDSLSYIVPASANLQYGTTYYVTVKAHNSVGDSVGCNSLSFSTGVQTPLNDECSTAIPVTNFPYTYAQTNASQATNNAGFIQVCPSESMNDGLWYKFTGDGTNHTISLSHIQSDFDAKLQVYSGSCNALSCVQSADNGNAGAPETVTFPTTAGIEYYVNVGSYSGSTDRPEGVFVIHFIRGTNSTHEVKKAIKSVTVSPNPFEDIVRFDGVDVQSVSVVDTAGRVVKTAAVQGNTVNLAGLKSGLYILVLKQKDGSTSNVKVIKK